MPVQQQFQTTTGQQAGTSTTGAQAPATTAQTNLNAIPGLGELTNLVNTINQSAQTGANQARIPGAAGLEAQSSQNIGSALQGQIPQDVIDLLAQQGAERGVAMGSPGSPNAQADLTKILGLTSLDFMGLGQNWLGQAYGRNPMAALFNPASMLVTPSQAGTTTTNSGTQAGSSAGSTIYPEAPQSPQPPQPPQSTAPTGASQGTPGDDRWWNALFPSPGTGTSAGTTIPGMQGYLGVQGGSSGITPSPDNYWSGNLDVMGNPIQSPDNYWSGNLDVMGNPIQSPDLATSVDSSGSYV